MAETTIKVPAAVRDRVRRRAHETHVTQARVIEHALDLLDKEQFFTELRQQMETDPDTPAEIAERDAWLADSDDVDEW